MSKIHETMTAFKGLKDWERTLVLNNLLLDGTVSFKEVSEAYVATLEKRSKIESLKLQKSSMWLGMAWKSIPPKKVFLRAASAYAIIRSGVVHTVPVEKVYLDYLKKHPYEEDEEGFPKTEIKGIA